MSPWPGEVERHDRHSASRFPARARPADRPARDLSLHAGRPASPTAPSAPAGRVRRPGPADRQRFDRAPPERERHGPRLACGPGQQRGRGGRVDGAALDPQARRRVDRELTTEEWKGVLDQAWSIGIPHVIFVGGEPTVRPDLLDLIRHAEQLGQVSGVVTSAEGLLTPQRLEGLAAAGVDHLLAVVNPKKAPSLDGLRQGVASDVSCAAHLTLDPKDDGSIVEDLQRVRETGVTHVSLSAPSGAAGAAALGIAQQALAEAGLSLVWDLPVPFAGYNPIRLEAGAGPEAGAWLYIEPDGDVLPAIGAEAALGNVLRDSIADMWRHAGEGLALPAS